MGQSEQTIAAEQAQSQDLINAARAYQAGFGGMSQERQAIQEMQAMGGEPSALRAAFGGTRAGLLDAATMAQADALRRGRQDVAPAMQGGNVGASLASPADMGAGIARALYGSRITEATSALEEQNKLLGFSVGQAQGAGSGALTAYGNELGNIPLMKNYNSTYANLMGALNLGTSLYGAGQQAGWFGGGNAGLLAGLGAGQTNPASIPFGGGSFAGTVGDMSSVG